jgi:hypothetical protein
MPEGMRDKPRNLFAGFVHFTLGVACAEVAARGNAKKQEVGLPVL